MSNMNKKNIHKIFILYIIYLEKQSKIFYSRLGLTELSITDNALYNASHV